MKHGKRVQNRCIMKLEIITPHVYLTYDDVTYISLPSIQGECGILPNHTNMVLALQEGRLIYQQGGATHECGIHTGFATITTSSVRVLTEDVDGISA